MRRVRVVSRRRPGLVDDVDEQRRRRRARRGGSARRPRGHRPVALHEDALRALDPGPALERRERLKKKKRGELVVALEGDVEWHPAGSSGIRFQSSFRCRRTRRGRRRRRRTRGWRRRRRRRLGRAASSTISLIQLEARAGCLAGRGRGGSEVRDVPPGLGDRDLVGDHVVAEVQGRGRSRARGTFDRSKEKKNSGEGVDLVIARRSPTAGGRWWSRRPGRRSLPALGARRSRGHQEEVHPASGVQRVAVCALWSQMGPMTPQSTSTSDPAPAQPRALARRRRSSLPRSAGDAARFAQNATLGRPLRRRTPLTPPPARPARRTSPAAS